MTKLCISSSAVNHELEGVGSLHIQPQSGHLQQQQLPGKAGVISAVLTDDCCLPGEEVPHGVVPGLRGGARVLSAVLGGEQDLLLGGGGGGGVRDQD